MRKFICVSLLLLGLPLFAEKVVIVGGGPSGLGAAIEAKAAGHDVTLIEKRDSYTRELYIFLFGPTLDILKKWEATIPQITLGEINIPELPFPFKTGFVKLKHVEEGLAKRVEELGIRKIHGEFKGLSNNSLLISTQAEEIQLPYDLLVAADGSHSKVREELGLSLNEIAKGTFLVSLSDLPTPSPFFITEPVKGEDFTVRQIKINTSSYIFLQGNKGPLRPKLDNALNLCNAETEKKLIKEDRAQVYDNIPVFLQQAKTFSSESKSAILIGDAAATASPFEGMGANTAIKTAEIAGEFFKKRQEKDKSAYSSFNESMKQTTDAMIENSRYLFE